jgi:AraC-like DNA-binding protein
MSSAAGTWLETTLRYTIAEAMDASPGRGGILPRLAELLFVDVIRHYMQQLPEGETGWLAAIRDPQVGRALQLIHAEPTRSWTVDTLASRAALSRSSLAERFARLVGETPIRYHARWRVQLAKQLLRQPHKTVAEVASEVGFESEAAFSRAFKRLTGEPPSAWRRHQP